jgi:tetratricopeptide (TPR) repeat protein
VGVLYFLALGAKEIALALPLLLLLLDALDAEPGAVSLRRMARESWGMAVATALALAAFLALRRAVLGAAVGAVPAPYLEGLSTTERWAAAVATWPEYVRLLLWPARLSAEWGPDLLPVSGWGDARTWLGLAIGIAVFAAAAAAWRRQRWVSVAILWFAAAVFPISNLPFGAGALVTERSLYLPSAAVAFLAPPLVALLVGARPEMRRLAALGATAVLALAAARTWTRTPAWASTNAVFETMAREAPELWMVEWRLAKLLKNAGRGDEALAWYASAQEKARHNHTAMAVETADLLLARGRAAEAERTLRTQLPRHADVPGVHALLARALYDLGRPAEAAAAARAARRVALADEGVRANTLYVEALSLDVMGRRAEALVAARAASASRGAPARRGTRWLHYARLLRLSGDEAGAAAALDSARALTRPEMRGAYTLDPLPEPRSPVFRDWARGSTGDAPAGPAVAPAPRGL